MNRVFVLSFAFFGVLAISSIVQAQESAADTAVNDDIMIAPDEVFADSQASVSDLANSPSDSGMESGQIQVDWLGCGNELVMSPATCIMLGPGYNTGCCFGSCDPCCVFADVTRVQGASYLQPSVACVQFGLVTYQEPVVDSIPLVTPDAVSVVTEGSVSPMSGEEVSVGGLGPAVSANGFPTMGCTNCGTSIVAPIYNGVYPAAGCSDCTYRPPRFRLRNSGRRGFRR